MKILARLLFVALVVSATSVVVLGQETIPKDFREIPERNSVRTNADETFELNIDERRFTRENFEASTSVSTDGNSGLNLQIGVALTAGRIEVLLRNVHGSVRFRGTLDRILDVIGNRRVPSSAPPPK
jgi:hypothetical protein